MTRAVIPLRDHLPALLKFAMAFVVDLSEVLMERIFRVLSCEVQGLKLRDADRECEVAGGTRA